MTLNQLLSLLNQLDELNPGTSHNTEVTFLCDDIEHDLNAVNLKTIIEPTEKGEGFAEKYQIIRRITFSS